MQVEDSLVSEECEEALLVIIILLYCFASLPSVRLESDAKALARKLSALELSLVAVDFVRDGWLNPVRCKVRYSCGMGWWRVLQSEQIIFSASHSTPL